MKNSNLNRYFLFNRIVKDTRTDLHYEFNTTWGAKLFYDQVTEFDRKGFLSSGTITPNSYGTNLNDITTTSNFVLILGNEEYKRPLNRKPNLIQRLILRLMGFKKT